MAANPLPDLLETAEAERLDTGFKFTEGALWHPDGYWYFVDLRNNRLHRIRPGQKAELVRATEGGNGTTLDLQGNLRKGGTMAIAGFGNFRVARQAARTGRNTQTGSLSFFSDRRK